MWRNKRSKCRRQFSSVVIGILLQSTAWYTGVKQHWPRLLLGWVTVLVCQFLLIVLQMRLLTQVPLRCSCGDSMNFPLGFIWCNFYFLFFFFINPFINRCFVNHIKCFSKCTSSDTHKLDKVGIRISFSMLPNDTWLEIRNSLVTWV